MRRILAGAAALLLVCDVVVLAARAGDDDAPAPSRTSVLAPDEATVTGFATGVEAHVRVVDTVGTPFAVELPAAATGGATIDGALVEGRRTSIVWGGGEPLRLTGGVGGGLDVGAVRVVLGVEGEVLSLDGAPRRLLPGRYRTTATVAVATGGLAASRDDLTFTADDRTRLVTRGGASVRVARRPVLLDGPGRLVATGRLSIRRAGGTTATGRVAFGPGPYRVELLPSGDGYRVAGTLRGPLSVA